MQIGCDKTMENENMHGFISEKPASASKPITMYAGGGGGDGGGG